MKIRTLFTLFICLLFSVLPGRIQGEVPFLGQRQFVNKTIDIDHIEVFFQDSIGRMWAGTFLNGLMMFDGQTFVRKTPTITYKGVHCFLSIGGYNCLVGTRNGLFRFNWATLSVELIPETKGVEVVNLFMRGEDIWVFCANKILRIDGRNGVLTEWKTWNDMRLFTVVDLSADEFLCMTAHKGVYRLRLSSSEWAPIFLQGFSPRNEMLLTMVRCGDACWMGSDKGLMKYENGHTERIGKLENICVKTLMVARNGSLWIGTDNGLYIYNPIDGSWEHYIHDNRDNESLLSNCVWSIYEDKDGNKWLGVDGGISVCRANDPIQK